MSLNFSVEPVDEKPKKNTHRGRKGSKYEPILTAFLETGHKLVRVDSTGLSAAYLSIAINKIIKKKGIDSVKVSVRDGKVFLEK